MNLTGEINVNIHKLFPSRWLTAADLDSRDWKMTVIGLKIENIGQPPKNEDKPILYFKGTEKALVLNKTNGMLISSQHGPETDNWMGKVITLYPTRVKAFGGLHDCIRVRDGNYISSAPDPVVEADDDMPPDEDPDPIAEPPTNGADAHQQPQAPKTSHSTKPPRSAAGAQAEAIDTEGYAQVFGMLGSNCHQLVHWCRNKDKASDGPCTMPMYQFLIGVLNKNTAPKAHQAILEVLTSRPYDADGTSHYPGHDLASKLLDWLPETVPEEQGDKKVQVSNPDYKPEYASCVVNIWSKCLEADGQASLWDTEQQPDAKTEAA